MAQEIPDAFTGIRESIFTGFEPETTSKPQAMLWPVYVQSSLDRPRHQITSVVEDQMPSGRKRV
jgi:hypothetical protein